MANKRIPISVIIMTKNEERVLAATLESVAEFSQVFVVDSGSEDGTCQIAKDSGAEIVQFEWNGRYPKKKEWCLQNLAFKHEWVLYLDADESVTPALATELRQLLDGPVEHVAYDVQLDYYFLGKHLRHGHRVVKRVLLRRDKVAWPHIDDLEVTNMWEVEGHYQPVTDGSVGHLRESLKHDDPDPLYDYFARHNRYSDWEAYLLSQEGAGQSVQDVRSAQGRRYAALPFKPAAFFCYSYFARRGFLDGRAGFHYAVAHAFYFWQISIKRRERAEVQLEQSIRDQRSVKEALPFRALQLAASIAPRDGGPSTATVSINRHLRKLGSLSVILSTDADGKRASLDVETTIPVSYDGSQTWYCARSRPQALKNSWSMAWRSCLLARSADILHIHGVYLANSIHGYLASRITSTPYILQPHGTLEPYQETFGRAKKSAFNRIIGDRIIKNASLLLAASDHEAENLRSRFPNVPVEVVPLGVSRREPKRPLDTYSQLETWLSVPKEKRVIFLGRLAQKKRPDMLVSAWKDIQSDARLLFVGPQQDWSPGTLAAAMPMHRRPSVGFLPGVDAAEVAWCLSNAGIFVLPSENENFGIAVAEAMTYGCAVITTTETAAAEHVQACDSGIILPHPQVVDLKDALQGLLEDSELVKEMGQRGTAYAQMILTWDNTAQNLQAAYAKALG